MVEKCIRCRISEKDVKLYDAIYDGRSSFICERCSIIENIPILKRPSSNQLRDTERGLGVYDRMKRLTGIDGPRKNVFFREDKLKELDRNPELELPEDERLNLIPHYYWEIMKNRRRKGLSHEKLAEAIGESVLVIKMIEKGKLPENAKIVINKLEQFFQVRLRFVPKPLPKNVVSEPVLLDSKGNRLDRIPEPRINLRDDEEEDLNEEESSESEYIDGKQKKGFFSKIKSVFSNSVEEQDENSEVQQDKNPFDEVEEIDLKKINTSEVTISDLKEVHKRKLQVSRQEQLEEQKRIEERQRLVEARKEELRIRRAKESKDLDNYLGGSELVKRPTSRERERISSGRNVEEFDRELM